MSLRDVAEKTALTALGCFAAGVIGWVAVDSWRNNSRAQKKASRQVPR